MKLVLFAEQYDVTLMIYCGRNFSSKLSLNLLIIYIYIYILYVGEVVYMFENC
jgi:hypothetical protein